MSEDLEKYINNIFKNNDKIDPISIKKEINSMRNTQPPLQPTFVLGQDTMKKRIKQKLSDCLKHNSFSQVVITGDVGDGKTHFMNWIWSKLNANDNFYTVKSRVEESASLKNNFIKMVISKLFKNYYDEFCRSLSKIEDLIQNIKDEKGEDYPEEEYINTLASKKNISGNLAFVIYKYNTDKKLKYSALNILGCNDSSKDYSKIRVKRLRNEDYIKILSLFMKNKEREGFLAVILDEFEHAYTLLTPAAKRNFLISYKIFIDKLSIISSIPIVLLTAVTEQYEGRFQKGIEQLDTALWSRLKPHIETISRFSIVDQEEFNQIYQELAKRYKIAYNHDVGLNGALEMRKKMFSRWGEDTAQGRKNREIISMMLKIMDDLRSENKKLGKDKNIVNNINNDKNNDNSLKDDYKRKIEEAENLWDNLHYNAKPGRIRKGLEKLIKHIDGKIVSQKTKDNKIYMISKDGKEKFIYIAATGKNLDRKLKNCDNNRKKLKSKDENKEFITYFIYAKGIEDITPYFENYPNILPIGIDTEIYDLICFSKYGVVNNISNIFLNNLSKIKQKLK